MNARCLFVKSRRILKTYLSRYDNFWYNKEIRWRKTVNDEGKSVIS